MNGVQQDILCVLLQTLLDQKRITQEVHDKSRNKILSTLDFPEFFHCCEAVGKENVDGGA